MRPWGARKRAARVRSDGRRRTARNEIMLERRTRREGSRERVNDAGRGPCGKSCGGGDRPDISTGGSGTDQNAAKAVVVDRPFPRSPGIGSVQTAGYAEGVTGESKGIGRRHGGEEGLQQERINRERAKREAFCQRSLS